MDKLLETLAETADGFASLFKARGDSYIDLETCEFRTEKRDNGKIAVRDLRTLVRPDGTLVTIFQVRGAQAVIGTSELPRFSEQILSALKTPLQSSGHTIEVVFRRDMDTVRRDIDRALQPARATASRLNMDVDWIIDAKRDTLTDWCASEACWIALSTDYRIYSPVEAKQAGKDRGRQIDANPIGKHSMNMAGSAASMRASHLAVVQSLGDALKQANVHAIPLKAHDALWVVRREFDPEATSDDWRPLLPGDRLPLRWSVTERKQDLSSVLYPRLAAQLVPRAPGRIQHNRWIEIGDRIHAPTTMSVPPQQPKTFDTLMAPLINSHIPFRISITLLPDGLSQMSLLKQGVASVTDWLPGATSNKQFVQALEALKEAQVAGETIVGMRVLADTWVRGDDHELLRTRAEYLNKAIQSWGQCDTRDVIGDPLAGVAATIPGMTREKPAPVSAPPLDEVVTMLPLSRPASPWDRGALPLRSPDGKLLPYQPGSSLQKAWVTLGFAPMGAGKSVLLNAHNFALALLDGLDKLPYISILDIGPSSTGLISLIQHSLPDHQKHLALHHKLHMRAEDAITPFETPLGLRRPLPEHRSMLVDFLTTLATPEGETRAQDGIPGIAQTVVDLVFDNFAPENQPKRFDSRIDPELTRVIEEHDIPLDKESSWWEIEDALFEKGQIEMAQRAHSLAVPILPDCAQVAHDPSITNVYTGTTSTNETMAQYFWRVINEAVSRYPILSRPTQFAVGAARVVALDLAEVCPKGGAAAKKQTGIMYSLARYAVAQRYYLNEDSVPYFPERYQPYYRRMAEEMKGEPKLLSMDEFHRTGGQGKGNGNDGQQSEGIRRTVENDIREGRKFGVQVALFSQDPNDFDDIFVELSTTRFVLGADTPMAADQIAERFGLTDSARDIILNQISKPGPQGSAIYLSTRTERGSGEMFAYLTLGPIELWAYNSSAKDRALRDALYKRVGVRKTLEALAERFPGGSAISEIDRRQERAGGDRDAAGRGIIQQMVDEILDDVAAAPA